MLTREGWLQPWVRLRKTEDEERQRLAAMTSVPDAQSRRRNQAGRRRPCRGDATTPAQHSAGARGSAIRQGPRRRALLIGDLWRWGMHRENSTESDLDRSWRQTVRWLVGDVPGRVERVGACQAGFVDSRHRTGRSGARRRVSTAR